MQLDSYYDYIHILAFKALFKYENKRKISIETLKQFRKTLMEEVIEEYEEYENEDYDDFYYQEDRWTGKVTFEEIDEEEALVEFLEDYSAYFYRKEDSICLREDLGYDDLEKLEVDLRLEQKISCRIDCTEEKQVLFEVLGIHSIEKELKQYLKIEHHIENMYNLLYTPLDNSVLRNKLKECMKLRTSFLLKLSLLPDYKISAFNHVAGGVLLNIKEFSSFPIDEEKWKEYLKQKRSFKAESVYLEYVDPLDGDMEEELNEVLLELETIFSETYQYALFGSYYQTLFTFKLAEDISNFEIFNNTIYLSEKSRPPKEIFATNNQDQWIFYLTYIHKLNIFMNLYGTNEELLQSKKRLLYLLDNPREELYVEENFEKAFQTSKKLESHEDAFIDMDQEIFFFISDVFENNMDQYTIKKLLLIGTYYEITQEEEIKEAIMDYEDDSKFDLFSEIMLYDFKRKSKEEGFVEKGKELFKKYNPNINNS